MCDSDGMGGASYIHGCTNVHPLFWENKLYLNILRMNLTLSL
jgi:hypothetical protein